MAEWTEQDVKQIREWNEKDHPRGQPDNAGQFVSRAGTNKQWQRAIMLPKKEYAAFCSAIRTKYADKIPTVGRILNGDHLYLFRYNKSNEKIACTFKVPIVGNENIISELMS